MTMIDENCAYLILAVSLSCVVAWQALVTFHPPSAVFPVPLEQVQKVNDSIRS